jgi:putative ABC transport system permease protein
VILVSFLRQVRRSPGFVITLIATLATGIAASAAMFTVVDRVLLLPLPYGAAAQLVEVRESGKNGPSMFGAPFPDIEQWRGRSQSLQAIAFHTYDKPTSFLEGNSGPVQVNAPKVSPNLFLTLGVEPAMGCGFEDLSIGEFARNGDTRTAILSDARLAHSRRGHQVKRQISATRNDFMALLAIRGARSAQRNFRARYASTPLVRSL